MPMFLLFISAGVLFDSAFSLRVSLTQLRFHKFKHSFQDTLNPICNCGTVETTNRYLLHCPNFSNESLTLFHHKLQSIDENILSKDKLQHLKRASVR